MKILKTAIAIVILTMSFSCSKDNDQQQPEMPKVATVYAGGFEFNATTGKNAPTIWKNGVAKPLPTGLGIDGIVNAIFIDNNIEYAVGYESLLNTETTNRAVIWKDGIKQNLSVDPSVANAIYVSQGKVYVVGTINSIATLWYDNRTFQFGIPETTPEGIYVKENNIYVVGNNDGIATQWKNNGSLTQPSFTETFLEATASFAKSITVQNNISFIAGFSNGNNSKAKLWKNSLATE